MSIQLYNRPTQTKPVRGLIRTAHSFISPHSISFAANSPYTRQEFKDECDINTIMARYQHTGELPHINLSTPQFLDVSSSLQFQDSMNYVAEAQSMFAELPSTIRDRFRNDPGLFLEFCSNEVNRKELAHMGLLTPEATQEALYPIISPNLSQPTASPKESPKAPPEAI